MASLTQQLFRKKPVPEMTAESGADSESSELARTIGLFQLTLFGVGATIGTGIFIVLSQAVPVAGPAVIWSFVIAGTVAGLTAVCYAELASAVPVSGSSYSYAYATLGELPAMGVAACLLLEYGVSAAAVAVGWSQYLNEFLDNVFGFTIPDNFSQAPEQGGVLNLPAVVLIVLCALLLIRGASESAKVNAVMVMIKIGVLLLFVAIGIQGWNSDHLSDFAPFGLHGITSAAGIIFFSYIGLDAVSTAGEEVKNPRRNMPLAILISLVVVTGLYIVVIYGQTRILFAMARDGMLPEIFHKVNPRTLTPVPNTIIVAIVISLLAGLIPINFLAEMTSIGTLVAFLVVSVGVVVLRHTHPELPRGFKVPGYPVTPVLSVLGCLWIIKDLRAVTIWVFLIWVTVGLIWYAYYGFRHSHLGRHEHVGLIHDDE